ncbi:MAG: hypothetical protein ACOYB2_10975 [Limnohabitans sp.]
MTDEKPAGPSQEDIDAIQTPLVDDRMPASIESPADVLTPLPEGFKVRMEPDKATKAELTDLASRTLCGSPMKFTWNKGPWKDLALRMYCAEPFCVETGYCTGPMFVPSDPQYRYADDDHPFQRRRELSAEEIIAGARWAARKATGKDDPRSDRDIARFAGKVLQRLRAGLRGAGDWGM